MELKAPIGISITSYELDDQTKKYNPILTHIFWGNDIDQALGYAKSHLVTDYFFSSPFIGEMEWQGSVLYLDIEGNILGKHNKREISKVLDELANRAEEVNDQQYSLGIVRTIQLIK